MRFDTIHPLQPCWDLALSSVKAHALDAAIQSGVLAALEHPSTASALAYRLRLDPTSTRHMLDLLWAMAVVTRPEARTENVREQEYVINPELTPFLVPGGEKYYADAMSHRLQSLCQLGPQLSGWLKNGASVPPPPDNTAWAEAAEGKLAQEQAAVTAAAAVCCVHRLSGLANTCRFLDLGCGPGKVAIALAQAYPEWHGVIFDLPAAAAVAHRNIECAGLADRLESRSGSLMYDDIGEGYDLVWCSSVLHFMPDIPAALAKIRDALAPGGHFLSVHAELPADRETLGTVLPYYLPLIMRGHQVWTHGAMADLMRELGFESITSAELSYFPLAPAQVVIGRKERS